ncbi:MAG: porphobilinogen synthase [Coriobacteriia bacterium]|nr:porphobilinogen synthase [Coriobacteriia bacterium]
MQYPHYRPRRLRRTETLRDLVRETVLTTKDFIYPLYVKHGNQLKEEITSMPLVYRFSIDMLEPEILELKSLGIRAVLLFGIPDHKDPVGSESYDPHGAVQEAIAEIHRVDPDMIVITDVCMCEYTSHGHCGALDENNKVDNDASHELLIKEALSHVKAGADIIAPSDMMDGRVGALRKALDDAGYSDVPIMAYSAKFASAYYGPFREAAESTPQFGNRKGYQMDCGNANEALREVELDIQENADFVMVKPALAYLDILWRVKERFGFPTVTYNVSGEYTLIKGAAKEGWIDERAIVLENLLAMKRAGADLIITYHAKEAARWILEDTHKGVDHYCED